MIESRGDILLTRDPALDQNKQNDQIHELLSNEIDLLVINPVDFQQISPALEEARQANVPVVIVDSQVSDPELVACTIASDNYGAGVLCAEHLMQTRDSARIALLEHPAAQSGVDRIQGFCDTIAAIRSIRSLAVRTVTVSWSWRCRHSTACWMPTRPSMS